MAEFNNSQTPNQNPVNQLSNNYFVVDLNDAINPTILEHYLKTEFAISNIDIPYEYAIYDCDNDEMVYGNYISNNSDSERKRNTDNFQKFDEYLYYFGIHFPGKKAYVVSRTNIWLISGFVLITAIAFFAYAIMELLRQRKLSEIQKDFINNMTHEFKTPVSTIGISSKVLSDPEIANNPERLSNYANIIYQQNKNLEEKIEKILQSSLSEKASVKLEKTNTDLNEIIRKVSDNFNAGISEKNGEIKLMLQNDIPTVMTDKFHFSNILFNLLDNASKYCISTPIIQIKTYDDSSQVFIVIKDNGSGIDSKHMKKIYEKFYRIPRGNVHDVKGFGLGLSYVLNIVKAHGWKINVESKIGEGSTFTVSIPIKSKLA